MFYIVQYREAKCMRNCFYILFIIISLADAGLVNHNPDPNGEPWYSADAIRLSQEQLKRISEIPVLEMPEIYKNRKEALPYYVDNSLLPFFRPVFCQEGASCAQASGVGYIYTYEMNLIRGTNASLPENQYPTHYTYNFLNDGSGLNGSWHTDGWNIIASGGCPSVADYGGMLWPSADREIMNKLWISDPRIYESGMKNRISGQTVIRVHTQDELEVLKQWFNDHCDGSTYGGVVAFAAGVGSKIDIRKLSGDSFCPGEPAVVKWDPLSDHIMTFVGYNDSIRWDYNGDGKYTNDIDINGDGMVDLQDWEIGAFRMVNSWGTGWCDSGKAWVMYRTLAQSLDDGGIANNAVYGIKATGTTGPKLMMKVNIESSDRDDLKLMAGITEALSAPEPRNTIVFPYFSFQGGDQIGMSGDSGIISLELDISLLLNYTTLEEGATIFLSIVHSGDTEDIPVIRSFSVIDEEGREFASEYTDMPVRLNSTTHLGVNYPRTFFVKNDVLPDAFPDTPYSNTMQAAGGTPPYNWEIKFDYIQIANSDDFPSEQMEMLSVTSENDGYATVNIGFDFPYFGKLYRNLFISTNGSISFDTYKDVQTRDQLKNTVAIGPCVANLKLYSAGGDGIFYYEGDDYVVIRWITSMYRNSKADLDFAAKLYSDGRILFIYGENFTTGLSWCTGISNGTLSSIYYSSIFTIDPRGQKTTFYTEPYPYGLEINGEGIFSGTVLPTDFKEWNILFKVTDANNYTDVKELSLSLSDPAAALSVLVMVAVDKNESSVLLIWEKVSGAASYNVYRSELPYSGFTLIGSSESLSYEDTDVSGAEKYFYYITAFNSFK